MAPILAAAGRLPHARLDTGGPTTVRRKQAVRMYREDRAQMAGDGRN
jgi:hypothetical protein